MMSGGLLDFNAIFAVFWFMFPAYIANSFAVMTGGGTPIDFGKKLGDGKRILGDGKSWAGLIGGVTISVLIGCIQNYSAKAYESDIGAFFPVWSESQIYAGFLAFLIAFGAMFGDSVGSFIKRRKGIGRGDKALLLDQLTFILFAWIFVLIFAYPWFVSTLWHPVGFLLVLIITPVVHKLVNVGGYMVGMKKEPW